MSSCKDRTEDFKDAVRVTALGCGFTEAKLAAVLASFIVHKAPERSSFTKAATKMLASIRELEQFIVKYRKDYIDPHRTTEQDKDTIEHEVGIFIKACKDQIQFLVNRIREEDKNESTTKWILAQDGSSDADIVAHRHGVVLILSEKLHSVTAQFDHLRSIRFQDAVNRTMPRRKIGNFSNPKSSKKESSKNNTVAVEQDQFSEINAHEQHFAFKASTGTQQQQILDYETRALQAELTSLLDAVQETETKMVEMSALNHLMSTHVLQQAQQIEQLYVQAVEATTNVERGNKELSQAIRRNSGSRTFLLLFLFVLTFSVLFLDWYN